MYRVTEEGNLELRTLGYLTYPTEADYLVYLKDKAEDPMKKKRKTEALFGAVQAEA